MKAKGNVTSLEEGSKMYARNFCAYAGGDNPQCEQDQKSAYKTGLTGEDEGDGE